MKQLAAGMAFFSSGVDAVYKREKDFPSGCLCKKNKNSRLWCTRIVTTDLATPFNPKSLLLNSLDFFFLIEDSLIRDIRPWMRGYMEIIVNYYKGEPRLIKFGQKRYVMLGNVGFNNCFLL